VIAYIIRGQVEPHTGHCEERSDEAISMKLRNCPEIASSLRASQ